MNMQGWIAALIGMGACAVAGAQEASSTDIAFLQGNHATVAQQCPADHLAGHMTASDEAACLLSVRALMQQHQCATARERIAALQRTRGSAEWRGALQLALADTYYIEGNWASARPAYALAVEAAQRTPIAPQAVYGLARMTQYQGDRESARGLLMRVMREAPWSFEADMAREILNDDVYLSVQVGSFHNRDNAVRMIKDLQSQGKEPYLVEATAHGEALYRVRVGRHTSYAEAERVRDELDHLGYTTRIFP